MEMPDMAAWQANSAIQEIDVLWITAGFGLRRRYHRHDRGIPAQFGGHPVGGHSLDPQGKFS